MSKKLTNWQAYHRLLGYASAYRLIFILALIAMLFDAIANSAFVHIMEPLMDQAFVAKNLSASYYYPLIIFMIIFMRGVASFAGVYGMTIVGRRVIEDLRQQILEKYLNWNVADYNHRSTSQMITKMIYNVEQVANAVTTSITILIRDSLYIIFILAVMFSKSVILTITFLTVGPIIALLVALVSKRFKGISRRIQESMSDVTQATKNVIEGYKVIKIFGGQQKELTAFNQINQKNRRLYVKLISTNALSSNLVILIAGIAVALIVFIATLPAVIQTISPGIFAAFFAGMLLLFPPLKRLSKVNENLQRGIVAAESIFEVLDSKPEIDSGNIELKSVNGELQFINVGLTYHDQQEYVIDQISFIAQPGTVTAIVGQSGSGKTSLVNLIPRFYQASAGKILLDSIDINSIKLADLRKHIALVSQDIVLFNDTVANNIAYGELATASVKEVEQAAKDAYALDFINELPDGMQTMIGENGALLSGGQRQRIAIARALLKNAPILILDEATSALDTQSEKNIQQALDKLMKTRTTMVIAHRLSTVENADQVIALHQGKIVEQGTHKELLAQNGYYASLYKMQFK